MSLEEKAGQLSIFSDPARTDGPPLNPGLVTQSMAALQRVAIEQSPHGIPLIFAGDVIHGMKTTFPVPLGEAASFDPELARRTARAAAVEASAKGIQWVFAPMVDVARDQRWGRVVELSLIHI